MQPGRRGLESDTGAVKHSCYLKGELRCAPKSWVQIENQLRLENKAKAHTVNNACVLVVGKPHQCDSWHSPGSEQTPLNQELMPHTSEHSPEIPTDTHRYYIKTKINPKCIHLELHSPGINHTGATGPAHEDKLVKPSSRYSL